MPQQIPEDGHGDAPVRGVCPRDYK